MPEATVKSATAQLQKAIDAQAKVQQAARDAAQGKDQAPKSPQGGAK